MIFLTKNQIKALSTELWRRSICNCVAQSTTTILHRPFHRNSGNITMLGNSTYCKKWCHWKWKAKASVLFSSGTRISSFLFSELEVKLDSRNSHTRTCGSSQWWEVDEHKAVLREDEFLLWCQAVIGWVEAGTSCKLLSWDIIAHRPALVLSCPPQFSLHKSWLLF